MDNLTQTTDAIASTAHSQPNSLNEGLNKYFEVNRYQQFGNIRFIPTSIDKNSGESTVAIYKVTDGKPLFLSAFFVKVGDTRKMTIEGQQYNFTAKEIKPWRKYLGTFNTKDALFFNLSKVN